MLRHVVVVVAVAACGRSGFNGEVPIDASLDAPADSPRLAALVCQATTIPITPVATGTEVAAYRSSAGYHVAWNQQNTIIGTTLDAQLAGPAPSTLLTSDDMTGLAGMVDTGEKVMMSVPTSAGSQLWALATDLTAPVKIRDEAALPSREPFASDAAGSPRVWVRGTPTTIVGAFFHDDASIDNDGTFTTGGPVTSMSMEDGPDHTHVTWTEQLGPTSSRCFASDIRYNLPNPPVPTGPSSLSDDCYDARTASGPDAADSMIVVWQTAAHTVEAAYLASTGNIMRDMSFHGRMPRVRFDGTEFWIAWIDEGASDQLHLASFDLHGNVKDVALPDWKPVGDQAFQLVRRGATVYLVVLSANTVNFLLTCS
jgi:hypothetical protein